jgi:PIN domain nuclease of toxin-antitoxin system
MTKRRPGKLSVSSEAYEVYDPTEAVKIVPEGHVTAGKKVIKREAHGAINGVLRSIIQAEWESGETVAALAKRHGITARTIHRWKNDDNWERSADGTSTAILEHARAEIRRKVERSKIEVTAAIEDVVASHKAATQTLNSMMQEAMSRALAYPHKDPFRQLLIVKVASEVARNIQMMDRKTWGIDESKTKTTTEIFDVLTTMESKVERQALAVDRSASIKSDHGE